MERFNSEGQLNDPNVDEQVHEVVQQLLVEAQSTMLDSIAA